MKTLTDNRVSKIPGFSRAPELDFSDDGTRFQGFVYKHLPMSQARSCGLTFLSVRVDYLSEDTELKFVGTYEDYSKEPWYKLCDKYNGVKELPEMEEIVKDLETILTGVKELNKRLEKIIELVERYKVKVHEKSTLESKIREFKRSLENFMDTGNKHIFVEFAHGAGSCDQLYSCGIYPSDTVKEAIKADVLNHIEKLEGELMKVNTDILNLSKWITSGVQE